MRPLKKYIRNQLHPIKIRNPTNRFSKVYRIVCRITLIPFDPLQLKRAIAYNTCE